MAFKWFKKKTSPADKDEHPTAQENDASQTSYPEAENHGDPLSSKKISNDPPAFEAEQPNASHTLPQEPPAENPQPSGGFFKRLKTGLSKTRKLLTTDIEDLFPTGRKIDDELLEELEELLITADIGVQASMDLIDGIAKQSSKISDAEQLKNILKEKILASLSMIKPPPETVSAKPHVIMVIGINGVGKTTTVGKLAAHYASTGKKVLIAAADTFRAAAVEQLGIWAQRAGVEIVRHRDKADPAAVVYDGIDAATARGIDIVLIDTAGRLHTRVNLMEELKKITRTIAKKLPTAPHEILLVLDATTGQNALSQAKMFNEAIGVTGIVLAKLDGTAKGGIVVSICNSLDIPLKYIGIGEKIEDLQEFDPVNFVNALF